MKNYQSIIVYGIYFILLNIGFIYELTPYSSGDLSSKEYQHMILALGLLLVFYALPLALFFYRAGNRWGLPSFLFPVAVGSGWLIAGWMAALANDGLGQVLKHVFTNPDTYESWEAAFTAPFTEEPLKLLAAVLTLFAFRLSSKRAALLVGAGSGLGFQLSEDLSYAFQAITETPVTAVSELFVRLTGAVSSHWMMTALVTLGFYLIRQQAPSEKRQGVFLILGTIFFHFLWNSPFTSLEVPFDLHVALIAGLYCLLFFHCCRSLEQEQPQNF